MKISIPIIIGVSIFLIGCKKGDKPDLTEKYYFNGTIDNNPVGWALNATADPALNSGDTSRYFSLATYFYSQWGFDCITTDCYDDAAGILVRERNGPNPRAIEVYYLLAAKTYDLDQIKPFLAPGSKPYGIERTSIYNQTKNGVLIRYTENGTTWTSETGDQTGSTFESVEFKKATTNNDRYSNVWKARFSCTVYNCCLPPKTLQNCEIYGPAFYK
jgi:hypothetical protein